MQWLRKAWPVAAASAVAAPHARLRPLADGFHGRAPLGSVSCRDEKEKDIPAPTQVKRLPAVQLHEAVLSKTFQFQYDARVFGEFPHDRVFVEGAVDPTGFLAPVPLDPRQVPPTPSDDVVVCKCPETHILYGELCCVARRALQPGLTIAYAGEIYQSQKNHSQYSANYACNAAKGMVVDGSRYCNEAAFVNHYYGIATVPNCQLDESEQAVATICVIRPIGSGEELVVDYGLQYCLRNQIPHPDAEDWARDLAALSLLTELSNRITSLEGNFTILEQQWAAGTVGLEKAKVELDALRALGREIEIMGIDKVQMNALSEDGRAMVNDFKQELIRRLERIFDANRKFLD